MFNKLFFGVFGSLCVALLSSAIYLNLQQPARPVATAPAPRDRNSQLIATLPYIRAGKNQVEVALRTAQAKVAESDPKLAERMGTKVAFFHDHLGTAIIDNGRKLAHDQCPAEPCYDFIVASLDGLAASPIGLWNPLQHSMVIDPRIAIDDPYLVYIVYHELTHALDTRLGTAPLPNYTIEDVPVPEETDAVNLESSILRATTGQRYSNLVAKTASEVKSGGRRSKVVNAVSGFEIPAELGQVFDRPLSENGLKALVFIYIYDVNRDLIEMSDMKADKKAEALAHNFARIVQLNQDPIVKQMVTQSVQSWWRPI